MTKKKLMHEEINLNKLKKASMALDDLVWTLQSIKIDSLKDASNALHAGLENRQISPPSRNGGISSDPNKHFLIGVLPKLFQDKKIFPLNEDILEFAGSALGLEMSRSEKRSRYEIIGKVVCETDGLDESRLTSLVSALDKLVGNKDKLAQMAKKKKLGSFSWNETIQDLLRS